LNDERLADLFRRDAAYLGLGSAWLHFAAGRLGVAPEVVERLAVEPVPPDEAAAQELGSRHGVDGWLLWLTVRDRLA
jgi:hypothetical protein